MTPVTATAAHMREPVLVLMCPLHLGPMDYEGSGIRLIFGCHRRLCASCCLFFDLNKAGRLREIVHAVGSPPLPELTT